MKRRIKDYFRTKGFYISLMAGAICIVAVAALFLNTLNSSDDSENIAQNSGQSAEIADKELYVPDIVTAAPEVPTKAPEDSASVQQKTKNEKKTKNRNRENNKDKNADEGKDQGVTVMESGENVSNLSFNQDKGIIWPVSGEVAMKFSADSPVYFKTLGQYRTNPALIISAAEGANVCSAADAVVTKVSENEEIGKYVETSIGDDYKIIYGQLDGIQVEKGSVLKEGELIGSLAAPTKYYVDEGSNLYMQMLSGDEPVDPLIFLK